MFCHERAKYADLSQGVAGVHSNACCAGFSTTRLEAWETQPCAAKFLGEQLWGSVSMPQACCKNTSPALFHCL